MDAETAVIEAQPRIQKFVNNHKTAIAVIATASVCLVISRLALRDHDNFLKEHDLYDTFYALNDAGE